MYISIILYIYISIIIIYYYHYYIIISSIILLLLLLLLVLLLYNYYKFFIVFLYKVLWATHSIRVIQGLYHVIYFVSVDHTCHTYGQACPRALIWAFSLLAIADYRTLDTAQTVYDCVHTHLEKKNVQGQRVEYFGSTCDSSVRLQRVESQALIEMSKVKLE